MRGGHALVCVKLGVEIVFIELEPSSHEARVVYKKRKLSGVELSDEERGLIAVAGFAGELEALGGDVVAQLGYRGLMKDSKMLNKLGFKDDESMAKLLKKALVILSEKRDELDKIGQVLRDVLVNESGNVRILQKQFEELGLEFLVDKLNMESGVGDSGVDICE